VVTYAATVSITSPPTSLRLGQSASVTVVTGTAKQALAVPSVAVETTGSRSTVTLLENGQQTVTSVTLGVVGDSWTQITEGVTEGQQVVLTTTSDSASSDTGFPGGGFPGGGAGGFGGGAPPAGAGLGGRS
jgi:hypothetical protein